MPRPRPVNGKVCPDCKEFKSPGEFYQSEKYDGGLSPYCKPCHRTRNNGRWTEEREKMRTGQRASYRRNKEANRASVNARAKKRAERLRREDPAAYRAKKFFDATRAAEVAGDVTREYLTELFRTAARCRCCGKRLELEYADRETRRFRSNPAAPSIDRVNNRKGYTRSNIAVICWECNFRKTDLTLEDLAMLRKYIENYGDFDVV